MRARAGLSLVEAVVAMALLASGLLAIASTGARAARVLQRAEAIQSATLAAMSALDSLTQLETPASGSSSRDRYQLAWQVTLTGGGSRIDLTITYADGTSLRADTFAAHAARWPVRLSHVP